MVGIEFVDYFGTLLLQAGAIQRNEILQWIREAAKKVLFLVARPLTGMGGKGQATSSYDH